MANQACRVYDVLSVLVPAAWGAKRSRVAPSRIASWISVIPLAFVASTCGDTSTAPSVPSTPFTLSGTVRDSSALQDESPPRYTLSGIVRTPWNEPLFDVGVEAVADGRVRGGSTTTLTSGAYNMPGLAPVDYLVRVVKWGYYAPDMQVHLTGDSRLDVVMDRGKWVVRGSVEESPPCVAQPVRGATVRVLDSPDAGPDEGTSVTTSSTGEYRFDALRWGLITLRASRSGYVTADITLKLPALGYTDPTHLPPVMTAYFRLTPVNGTCGTTS